MLFGVQMRMRKNASIDITINNEQLEKVTNYKFLGILLDATLSWQDYLENAQKRSDRDLEC